MEIDGTGVETKILVSRFGLKNRIAIPRTCQTRECIERLDDVVLFFSDQEITWSGVVYVYLLGTDHLIPDVRLSTPLLAPCI